VPFLLGPLLTLSAAVIRDRDGGVEEDEEEEEEEEEEGAACCCWEDRRGGVLALSLLLLKLPLPLPPPLTLLGGATWITRGAGAGTTGAGVDVVMVGEGGVAFVTEAEGEV